MAHTENADQASRDVVHVYYVRSRVHEYMYPWYIFSIFSLGFSSMYRLYIFTLVYFSLVYFLILYILLLYKFSRDILKVDGCIWCGPPRRKGLSLR